MRRSCRAHVARNGAAEYCETRTGEAQTETRSWRRDRARARACERSDSPAEKSPGGLKLSVVPIHRNVAVGVTASSCEDEEEEEEEEEQEEEEEEGARGHPRARGYRHGEICGLYRARQLNSRCFYRAIYRAYVSARITRFFHARRYDGGREGRRPPPSGRRLGTPPVAGASPPPPVRGGGRGRGEGGSEKEARERREMELAPRA